MKKEPFSKKISIFDSSIKFIHYILMKLIITVFIFILFIFPCFSQKAYFDSLYQETATIHVSLNPETALFNVDLLDSIASSNEEKLKSILLRSVLLSAYGINEEAIKALLEAEIIARKESDYVSLTRIYGFIASIYREMNLNSAGINYLEKAKVSSKKVQNRNLKLRFQGNLAQETAHLELQLKNYGKALEHAHKSSLYFIQADSTIDAFLHSSNSSGITARIYLELDEIDSAIHYFEKAQEQLSRSQSAISPTRGLIFTGLAESYLALKEYGEAEGYLFKAEVVAEESNFFELKKEVYRVFSRLYLESNESVKYIDFNKQYMKLIKEEQVSRKTVADKLINQLYLKESYLDLRNNKQRIINSILFVVLILVMGILSWYIYNKRRNKIKFKQFIDGKQKKNVITKRANNEERSYMSEERELSILQSLKEMEETKFYLNVDISLPVLSSKIGVNQRYITYIIKKHKEMDFSTYINDLRISYIVNCLKTDPKYLKYKISYLAEKSGFSSHSRFTVNFKKITGTTPSVFIDYIRNQNEKINTNS